MKRLRNTLLLVIALTLLIRPTFGCGPDWPVAVFVKLHSPDAPYKTFVKGRIGIPQPGYYTHHLVIAYDYYTGRALNADEQEQASFADESLTGPWDNRPSENQQPSGIETWLKLRSHIGPIDGFTPTKDTLDADRTPPGEPYGTFGNCLDDAFVTASRTLQSRTKSYGPNSAEFTEWVRGQDAVFSNCGGDYDPRRHYIPEGQPTPPAPPAPHMPQPASKASLLLQQDRAYQIAAANFYATKYDDAISGFRTIAADNASPWSMISRYVIARAMVRRATLANNAYDRSVGPTPQQIAAQNAAIQRGLAEARTELLAMRAEPRMAPMLSAIDDMLDLVNARVEPDKQAITLAARLHGPHTEHFAQSLIDLSYIRSDSEFENPLHRIKIPADQLSAKDSDAADMLEWIEAVTAQDNKTALQRWHTTQKNVWLLAAMMSAKPTDPDDADLIAAAKSVSNSDPAYVAITYHRLRLSPRDATTHADLLTILPSINHTEGPSTTNLYAALNAATAPTLNDWLAQAGRIPASEFADGNEENQPGSFQDDNGQLGLKHQRKVLPLYTPDAATILNTRLPLRLLSEAAESTTLRPNLRFQLAQAAWTRAVLLDRPDIARRLSPILTQSHAAWASVLQTYNAAKASDDRHAAALFALMRFASTEPNVREGEERNEGFATYSSYRDNWWCFTVPPAEPPDPADHSADDPEIFTGVYSFAHSSTPDPIFVTTADREEAVKEIAQLRNIPRASVYFPREAFAWQKAHPHDPRTPELLGQAFRVVRNACGNKSSSEAEHQLFLALHHTYPTNHWTLRYRSWQ